MGNYPPLPDYRMAYDRDGSTVFRIDSQEVIREQDAATVRKLNDEGERTLLLSDNNSWVGIIFPELRNITGYYMNCTNDVSAGVFRNLQTSPDTTTGLDGEWSTREVDPARDFGTVVSPNYRLHIHLVDFTQVKGLRVEWGSPYSHPFKALHLYGTTEQGDRLLLWEAENDRGAGPNYFNWDDIQRGSKGQIDFRIKNNSTQTANKISIELEALTDAKPPVVQSLSLSTSTIPALGPGELSDIISLSRTTPLDAALSVWSARIVASADSFS